MHFSQEISIYRHDSTVVVSEAKNTERTKEEEEKNTHNFHEVHVIL